MLLLFDFVLFFKFLGSVLKWRLKEISFDVLICAVQGESVAGEVHDILPEVKLFVHISHGGLVGVHTLQGLWVILIKVGNKHKELPETSFLKKSHEA